MLGGEWLLKYIFNSLLHHFSASTSNYKLKVNVDGVSLDSCNGVYAREGVVLKSGQICAGGVKGKYFKFGSIEIKLINL